MWIAFRTIIRLTKGITKKSTVRWTNCGSRISFQPITNNIIQNWRGKRLTRFPTTLSILKNCTFSICSEGGIAHLSRSMKVPTICYFHQTMPWKGHDFDLKDFWTGDLYRPCNDVIDSEQLFRDICSNK